MRSGPHADERLTRQNGLKMLGRNPGRFDRLGGEFVFDVDEGQAQLKTAKHGHD